MTRRSRASVFLVMNKISGYLCLFISFHLFLSLTLPFFLPLFLFLSPLTLSHSNNLKDYIKDTILYPKEDIPKPNTHQDRISPNVQVSSKKARKDNQ